MKILFITSVFPDMHGGIGDYSYRLIEHLHDKDHEVHVLTTKDPAIVKESQFCRIYPNIFSWSIGDYSVISNIIDNVKPDIIHIQHDTVSRKNKKFLLNFLPLFLRIFHRHIKIVITIHEFREHRLRWKLRVLLMMVFSSSCIFVDKWDMEIAKRQFPIISPDKLNYIPIAANIIPSKEDLGMSKAEIRKTLNLNEDDILLFYFGFISPHKGVDLLLDVFEKVAPLSDKIKLVIISDIFSYGCRKTSYQEALAARMREAKFKSSLIALENLDERNLSLYMLASDIAVFPFTFGVSFQRGTFLACLAHGMPVITTVDEVFYPPFIVNGKDAILVKAMDSRSLYREISKLVTDKGAREKIGRNATDFYNQHFSWKSISERTKSLYHKVIS